MILVFIYDNINNFTNQEKLMENWGMFVENVCNKEYTGCSVF